MGKRRVVVTGLGLISPLGNHVDASWEAIKQGQSGIARVDTFDVSAFATQIAGQVKNFDPTAFLNPKDVKKMDPVIQYGMAAAGMALKDSGLTVSADNAERIGVLVGSGIGGINGIEHTAERYFKSGPRRISPFYIPSTLINMIAGYLSIEHGLKGPNLSVVSACATANHSIGMAMRMIQYGDADVMVAGGSECASTPTSMGGFCAMKAMSTRNDAPAEASRPWDKDRDGFVMGDGSGVLVLESLESAQQRGANIYCELAGFGATSDAYHMTAPCEDGEGASRCMMQALGDAELNPESIGYLNAHGTSTPLGDLAETQAIKRTFGDHAKRMMVSSTKSMTGHLLGAAGGIEAILTIKALHEGVIPPTINLHEPSEGCDLDYVPNVARDQAIDAAISNGFGFGGTNASLVFKKHAG